MGSPPLFNLGAWRELDGSGGGNPLLLPANHLVTHGVVVGMTGSGKTGFLTVLVEEALRNKVPTLVIDVKGDLPNLLLSFPDFDARSLEPWVEAAEDPMSPERLAATAEKLAGERRVALAEWAIGERELAEYCARTDIRVVTPGVAAGELLHVLSPLERRSPQWDADPDSARQSLSAAVSLVLRLLGRDPDPASSREHVLLSLLAERRLLAGQNAEIGSLMRDVLEPPVSEVGALPVNSFLKKKERGNLAVALNTLLASPTFSSWRRGIDMNPGAWLTPVEGRTPAVIVSVAHLDDEERALVLGLVLEETLSWVRTLKGTSRLRALVVFDEVYGYLPPHPASPPTKRPLVALMKQARAFGVGVVVATQNPMDLDYRALSNAGLWTLGRLPTDADRERVVDGMTNSDVGASAALVATTLKRLAPQWFVVQNTRAASGPLLLQPRHAMSLMRGPMTRAEIGAAMEQRKASRERSARLMTASITNS